MNEPIWTMDATAQAELVRRGEIHPRELVQLALARAEHFESTVHALASTDPKRARLAADRPLTGPFAGVPFVVKDLLPVPGLPCTFGSRLFAGLRHTPDEHVPYTRAIEASGVVVIGKSTTSEFGLLGSTETHAAGITFNPWDRTRSAGGSSGGSAAAVACGIVPIAHANDGGGSIRIPAALCGLFGFKPSRGRCVSAVAVPNDFSELTGEHCISRSVRDSAGFLACTERTDPAAPHPPVGRVGPGLDRSLRIGAFRTTLMGAPASAAGSDAVDRAARLCEDLGHVVEEVEPPVGLGARISEAFFTIAGAAMHDMETTMASMLGRAIDPDELEPFTWALIHWYRGLPPGALLRARQQLREGARVFVDFQSTWDVILSPTIGVPTPALGFLAPSLPRSELIARTEAFAAYTPAQNIVGAPGMSVPLHTDAQGLPVGCHFAAMPGDDGLLLRLAYQLEEAAPWADRWPALARDASELGRGRHPQFASTARESSAGG